MEADTSIAENPNALTVRYEPDAEDFYRMPWPSNHRMLDDGAIDLRDFPYSDHWLLTRFRAVVESQVHGFSTMPVAYFELNRAPGDASLPAPTDTLQVESSVQLLEIDGDQCFTRVPLEMQVNDALDAYLPQNVLEVSPAVGFVLKQGTTYAFIITKSFGQEAGLAMEPPSEFEAAFAEDAVGAIAESLAPLRNCLSSSGLNASDIAVATVFTTQNVIDEAKAIRDAVADPGYIETPVISDWQVNDRYSEENEYISYEATFQTPIFQDGETPYTQTGGDIHFDGQGRPEIQRWEEVPMLITAPVGEGPFPVLFFMDGTGWRPWGHVNDSLTQDALEAGFAVASYMPQFHGDRSGPDALEEESTFNFQNPAAGRNNLRQQLADSSYFLRVLREAVTDDMLRLDTSRIVFSGHSQGAQNGAMLAAVEPDIGAFGLSGLSSNFSITIVERKDLFDFEQIVMALFGIMHELDRFHPVIQIAQLGAEVTETHNYVTQWDGSAANPSGADVYVTNGYNDATTHWTAISGMTIAADLAPIEPAGWDVDVHGLWSRSSEQLPLQGNRTAMDGTPITLATWLSESGGHGTVYSDSEARGLMIQFLVTGQQGAAYLGF